eukprot:2670915-Pleurochrysis_carterae.AAC.1
MECRKGWGYRWSVGREAARVGSLGRGEENGCALNAFFRLNCIGLAPARGLCFHCFNCSPHFSTNFMTRRFRKIERQTKREPFALSGQACTNTFEHSV